jgi:hypothetical protein
MNPEHRHGLLVDRLTREYVAQKEKLGRGRERKPEWRETIAEMIRPHMEKMARLVKDWDVEPDVLMVAAFELAKSRRHPDGPFPNMFYSAKYLSQALGRYFDIPYEEVMEKRSAAAWLERLDADFEKTCRQLEDGGLSPVWLVGRPPEHRLIYALNKLDLMAARALVIETLEAATADYRVEKWLAHKGVTLNQLEGLLRG